MSGKLVDQTLESFSGLLASASPTPGGGTCAALSAALGVSFILMVSRITAEKPEFTDVGDRLRRIAGEAEGLRRFFLRLVDEDSAAYERFAAAGPGEEAAALRGCIRPPLELLEGSAASLRLALELSARYYRPTASDVGMAALTLETAACGAYLTVGINLKSGGLDVEEAAGYRAKSRSLLAEAEALSKEIYDAVNTCVEN